MFEAVNTIHLEEVSRYVLWNFPMEEKMDFYVPLPVQKFLFIP